MKCFVFIDGSNFYNGAKKLINNNFISLLHFDYQKFGNFLCKNDNCVEIRYYIGAITRGGDQKSEEMYANQQRLIALLSRYDIPVILGTIIRHPDKTFHEKGIDVRIAVEMIRLARTDQYDVAVLISSDTDLVPAVEEVQSLGKKVLYVGFPHNQSFGLTKVTDDLLILRKEDLLNFFPSSSLPKKQKAPI